MGGLIILACSIIPTLLWTRLDNRYVLLALLVTVWMGGIGFLDDYLKLKQKREGKKNEGLVERYKLAGQIRSGSSSASSSGKTRCRRSPGHRRRCRS